MPGGIFDFLLISTPQSIAKPSPGWNKVALLTAVRNSPCSCPFSVSLHPPLAALNSEPRPGSLFIANQKLSPRAGKVARSAERGAAKNSRMPRVIPPQLRLRSAERWLEYGRLAALPLAILPIPPDSPLAASPTGRARLESPVSRWRLLVQYKLGVQCRTPSRSDRFNGVTGGAGGPKGRNRNLHWPPLQKGYIVTHSYLFTSTPQSIAKPSPGWNKVALLTAVRNSPCSCPFSVSLHPPLAALNSEPRPGSLWVRFTIPCTISAGRQ